MKQFKISSQTSQGGAAVHILKQISEDGAVELQAIGPQATYRAVRAVAKSREMVTDDLVCTPEFMTKIIDGEERTGIRIIVRKG